MQIALSLVIPVSLMVLVAQLLNLKWYFSIAMILVLATLYVPLYQYFVCNIIVDQCAPEPLALAGYLFMWLIIVSATSFLHFCIKGLIYESRARKES